MGLVKCLLCALVSGLYPVSQAVLKRLRLMEQTEQSHRHRREKEGIYVGRGS